MNAKDKERFEGHYRENVMLIVQLMVIWALVSYGGAVIVKQLNAVNILTGFPLGYYMGSQGSLIVFVVLIFYYAYKMGKIDDKYGASE